MFQQELEISSLEIDYQDQDPKNYKSNLISFISINQTEIDTFEAGINNHGTRHEGTWTTPEEALAEAKKTLLQSVEAYS